MPWQPTMKLRWVTSDDHENTPCATTHSYSTWHYKLQQLWVGDEGAEEWRDIEVQHQ